MLSTQCSVTRVSAAERDKQSSSDALQVPLRLCSMLLAASAVHKFICSMVLSQVLTALSPSTEDVPNNGESWLQEVQQQVGP